MLNARQRRILELIAEEEIGTQKELAERLEAENIIVTQATVSRDIKALQLVKVRVGEDRYRYATHDNAGVTDSKFRLMMREFIMSLDYSENIIVINTAPGNANPVAYALDQADWEEVIGTIAGDDTVLLVVKPLSATKGIVDRLNTYINH